MRQSIILALLVSFFIKSLSPGKDHALFIAVADYTSSSWPDLRNPIRDAEAVAKELIQGLLVYRIWYLNPI